MNVQEYFEPYTQYIVEMTPDFLQPSAKQFFQRMYSWEMWLVYIMIIIVNILFLLSSIFGILSTWYNNLNLHSFNSIAFSIIWVLFSGLSYATIFMLWKNVGPNERPNDLFYGILFLIGSLLSLLWSVVFFQGQNIVLGFWFSIVLFLYYFVIMVHIWHLNHTAVPFMLPIVILYGYLVYSMIHLAEYNNVIL